MISHSNVLAWRIPRTEEPGKLESIGSQRVGHDRSDLVCVCVCVRSVTSNSLQPHGLSLARFLCPWDFPGKNT